MEHLQECQGRRHAQKQPPASIAEVWAAEQNAPVRLSENAHLLRYPHPSSLRRTAMYASFLGISEALRLDIFKQPP